MKKASSRQHCFSLQPSLFSSSVAKPEMLAGNSVANLRIFLPLLKILSNPAKKIIAVFNHFFYFLKNSYKKHVKSFKKNSLFDSVNDNNFSTHANKSIHSIPRTELPWYAISERDPKDQVFTKKKTADYCWKVFNQVATKNNFDMKNRIFVEPSAGEGCFMDLFPSGEQKLAFDIDPCRDDVIKQDFLEWSPRTSKNIAVVGNPPFGVRGAVALAFINRAAHFADLVSFILPMTFASDGKGGALTRVRGLTLLHTEELPANSFYQPDGVERNINTLWQIWGKGVDKKNISEETCNSYIEIFTACTAPDRRCGMRRMHEADFFIQGTFYKPPHVVKDFSDVKYGSGYGIVIKREKNKISSLLKDVDWQKHSSRATNHCYHIRMRHIRDAIIKGGFRDE